MIARWIIKTFIEIVFWTGIASSFMRTADLFQNFAPLQFAGYSTAGWYGIVCAVSIESLIIIAKYYYLLDPNRENSGAHEMSVKAGIAAWVLSFAAQGLDGVIVRDAMDALTPLAKDVIYWIVPAVPLMVSGALMIFGTQLIGQKTTRVDVPKRPNAAIETMKRVGNETMDAYSRFVNGIGRAETPKAKQSPKAQPPHMTPNAGEEKDSGGTLHQ